MTFDVAAILVADGIATGAIYVLVAIGTVLIFTVTRVIFIPFGDIAAFTALTLAAIETKQTPGTVGLVAGLAILASIVEISSLWQSNKVRLIPRAMLFYLLLPMSICLVGAVGARVELPEAARIVLALLIEGEPPKTLKAGDSYRVPSRTVHDARTGSAGAKVIATYVVEKGQPIASPAK
jgi:branched-chain amino acid transport system permease protein